jgi:HK97 family phage prohead protease
MRPNLTIPLEIKSLSEREFEGHGSVFKNTDLGGDIVLPGAFKRSLKEHRDAGALPQMFWMHDPSRVPGKWLEMSEDKKGLAVRGVLADTDLGNEIHTLLKMDAVRGLSIGYVTRDQDFDKDGNRLIKEADLWEVSVVSLPMNPLAQVAHVKSRLSALGEYVPTVREFERHLRDVGCSQKTAKILIAKMFDDDDSNGMLPGQPRDVVDVEDEAVKAAQAVLERIQLASMKLPKFA